MDPVPLRPLQRSMTRESTETSRLVNPDRPSEDRTRDGTYDAEEVDDFIAGKFTSMDSALITLIHYSQ